MPRARAQAADPPELRPGVPMEADPTRSDRPEPPMQPGAEKHLRRKALAEPTPVVGTAQPPRGLSGAMRRRAYTIAEHQARHWMLLLLADRVDVLEGRVGATLAAPFDAVGVRGGSRWVQRHPLVALGAVASVAWIATRTLRRDDSSYEALDDDC